MMTTIQLRLLALASTLAVALVGCSLPATINVEGSPRAPGFPSSQLRVSWPTGASSLMAIGDSAAEVSPGGQKPRPTASTAKVIAALTVLAKYPLKAENEGPELTLTSKDVQRYLDYAGRNGTFLAVHEGMKLTQREMLEAMLLPSANNIADSLAIWAFGSMNAYSKAATEYVKSLGMASTTIGPDASGYDPATTSTPGDLALLARAAMKDTVIAEIVSHPSLNIPGYGPIFNTDTVLGKHGIVGLKTGTSPEAGGVFLFAAKVSINKHPTMVVGAVMGAGSNSSAAMQEAGELIDSVQDFGSASPNTGATK